MHPVKSENLLRPKLKDNLKILKMELKRFAKMKQELLQDPRYREKFIAMKNGVILETGDDELDLAEKVQSQFPDQVILVKKVTVEEDRVDLPSFEVVG
nr:hypothetical protein [Candidatus Sigynarchaeota archaeon]